MKARRAYLGRLLFLVAAFFFCLSPARAIDLSPLFTETTQPSSEFLGLLAQIRDHLNTSGATPNATRCGEMLLAEARLATPRTLSSGVSVASPTTDNEYFSRTVEPGGITGNAATVNYSAMWIKGVKGGPTAGNAGVIRVTLTATGDCNAGKSQLKWGTLSFYVPVNIAKQPDGTMGVAIGTPSKFVVEAECCNGRKEKKSYLDINGALIGVIPDPDAPPPPPPTQPPRTATQPYTQPQTSPPPPKPAPPPSPPPKNWTVENPCPECEPIRQHLLRERQKADAVQAQIDEFARLQRENEAKQAEAKAKIAQLQRELARKQGTGGSAYDPDTGNTTDAWTQADGSVKITVRDANGNVIDQRTRPSRAAAKVKTDIAEQEATLKELEAARAALAHELEYAQKLKAKHLKLADDLFKLLQDCIEEKCNTPQQVSCVMQPSRAITIGPKERFGPDSAASSVASGLLGSALGGLTKGMLGGGSDSGGGSGPELKTDPVKDKQIFTDPVTGTKVAVGSIIKDGRLLTSVNIESAKEGEPVIHQMYRERLVPQVPTVWDDYDDEETGPYTLPKLKLRDLKIPAGGVVHAQDPPSCKVAVQEPIGWEPYGIWEAWWSKLRIQVWKSTDGGPWVKTKDTGWMDWGSGVNALNSNNVMTAEDIPKTAWGSMGAQRPVGAPRSAGAGYVWEGRYVYPGRPAPERMVLHLAQPWKDPVTTTTMDLYPTYSLDGKVKYSDKMPDFKWDYKPKPPGGGMQQIDAKELRDMKPLKPGGGMQQIDPPAQAGDVPEESILDSFEYKTEPMS